MFQKTISVSAKALFFTIKLGAAFIASCVYCYLMLELLGSYNPPILKLTIIILICLGAFKFINFLAVKVCGMDEGWDWQILGKLGDSMSNFTEWLLS